MKTEKRAAVKSQRNTTTSGDYFMLMFLAAQVLSPDENYTKDDIIEAIMKETKVSKKEATKRFKLMADTGVIA